MAKRKSENEGETRGKNKPTPPEGVQFTSENQPSPKAKSLGHKRKRALKDLAEALITGEGLEKAKRIADSVGVELGLDEFTLENVMTLRQIEKALAKGDTPAYNAAMDRLRGKAVQSLDVTTVSKDVKDMSIQELASYVEQLRKTIK